MIDRLMVGSVLNSTNVFFDEEVFQINVRCSKSASLLFLSRQKLESFLKDDRKLQLKQLLFLNKLLKQDKRLVIDVLKTPCYGFY